MENNAIRAMICEAATDGLSPELAAGLLLEPSKWKEKLFDPTRDLSTIYKQYLKGDLGVGMLADAVQSVLVASNDMSDLADEVVKTYGRDATPGEIPDYAIKDTTPEDEQVEVLVPEDDGFTSVIIEHLILNWPADILEALYGDTLLEQEGMPPPRKAGDFAGTQVTSMQAFSPEDEKARQQYWQQKAQQKKPKQQFLQQVKDKKSRKPKQVGDDTLKSFEQGKVLQNILMSAQHVNQARQKIAALYKAKQWPELAQLYQPGGEFEQNLGMLAGDMMVLRRIVDSAVASGYGDRSVGDIAGLQAQQQEAWQPALLDPEISNELRDLIQTLNVAKGGEATYGQLQKLIQPFVKKGSAINRLSNRGKGRSWAEAPYSADQAAVSRLAGGKPQQAQEPVAEPTAAEPEGGAGSLIGRAISKLKQEQPADEPAQAEPDEAMKQKFSALVDKYRAGDRESMAQFKQSVGQATYDKLKQDFLTLE